MTRILVINPNTSIAVSDVIRRGLAAMAMADVAITVVNAPFGAEAIETPAEACIAAYAVLATLADHRDDADAVVVGAFGDPGLDAARSVMIAPVVGTAAAAFTDAAQDGRRFAVITLGSSMESSIRAAISASRIFAAVDRDSFPRHFRSRLHGGSGPLRGRHSGAGATLHRRRAPKRSCWVAHRSPAWVPR